MKKFLLFLFFAVVFFFTLAGEVLADWCYSPYPGDCGHSGCGSCSYSTYTDVVNGVECTRWNCDPQCPSDNTQDCTSSCDACPHGNSKFCPARVTPPPQRAWCGYNYLADCDSSGVRYCRTKWEDSNCTPNTSCHCYSNECMDGSSTTDGCCVASAPAVPVPTPAVVSGTSATLSWSHSNWGNGCAGSNNRYDVRSDKNSNPSTQVYSSSNKSITLNNLAGGTHYWKVRAQNSSLSSAYSTILNFCIKQQPAQPSCVQGATTSEDRYPIKWNAPSSWGYGCPNVNSYELYYYSVPNGESSVGSPVILYSDDNSPVEVTKIGNIGAGSTGFLLESLQDATYFWQLKAINSGQESLSGTCSFTINYEKESWWQSQEGDIHAQGAISSPIPDTVTPATSRYLSLIGAGGTPGSVSYGENLNLGDMGGEVSAKGWAAKTKLADVNIGVDYLANRLEVDKANSFSGDLDSTGDGTYYVDSEGPETLTLEGADLGSKKIVLFVEKNVEVTGDIIVGADGFFALIVKGNLSFTPDVKKAHGFYLAEQTLSVQSAVVAETDSPDEKFIGEGSFVGLEGVSLKRNLGRRTGNREEPGVFVKFRPDFFLNAPSDFLVTESIFQELAP